MRDANFSDLNGKIISDIVDNEIVFCETVVIEDIC